MKLQQQHDQYKRERNPSMQTGLACSPTGIRWDGYGVQIAKRDTPPSMRSQAHYCCSSFLQAVYSTCTALEEGESSSTMRDKRSPVGGLALQHSSSGICKRVRLEEYQRCLRPRRSQNAACLRTVAVQRRALPSSATHLPHAPRLLVSPIPCSPLPVEPPQAENTNTKARETKTLPHHVAHRP